MSRSIFCFALVILAVFGALSEAHTSGAKSVCETVLFANSRRLESTVRSSLGDAPFVNEQTLKIEAIGKIYFETQAEKNVDFINAVLDQLIAASQTTHTASGEAYVQKFEKVKAELLSYPPGSEQIRSVLRKILIDWYKLQPNDDDEILKAAVYGTTVDSAVSLLPRTEFVQLTYRQDFDSLFYIEKPIRNGDEVLLRVGNEIHRYKVSVQQTKSGTNFATTRYAAQSIKLDPMVPHGQVIEIQAPTAAGPVALPDGALIATPVLKNAMSFWLRIL